MNQPLRALHPAEGPVPFTVEEFMHIVLSGAFEGAGKVELVEGMIVRMSPAMTRHMRYQWQLQYALYEAYRTAGRRRLVQAELTLKLGVATLRNADVGVLDYYGDEMDYVDVRTVLLVAEIADTTRNRDLQAKRLDYARAGIPNYWVVDIEKRVTHLMSLPRDGDYTRRPDPVPFGQPIEAPETDRTFVID